MCLQSRVILTGSQQTLVSLTHSTLASASPKVSLASRESCFHAESFMRWSGLVKAKAQGQNIDESFAHTSGGKIENRPILKMIQVVGCMNWNSLLYIRLRQMNKGA